ncbi:MAG: helix-turn-helix domain-containing protein [bacterium]|nr:helix-turn-helix domain-containing protein [bacterium]
MNNDKLNLKDIGKRLEAFRSQRGLGHDQLAQLLDCTGDYICAVEKGESPLASKYLQLLIKAFHLDANWLLSGRGSSNTQPRAEMNEFMQAALAEARLGLAEGGIPIGSVLVYQNRIIGRGHNRRVQNGSVILHGEMDALENAGRRPASVYSQSAIYTTLSPCPMCSGAIRLYGIPEVVIGENFTFKGDEDILKNDGIKLTLLQAPECIRLMTDFITDHPQLWNEDIGE